MKKSLALLLSLLMLLSLCACGSAGSKEAQFTTADSNNGYAMNTEAYWEPAEDYGGFAVAEEAEATSGSDAPAMDPEKIIYSASATVETTEFELTLERLQAMVKQYDGFVESSSINGSNYYNQSRGYSSTRSASYTIRIPSQRFQELMGSLSTLGNVPYSHTYTENITSRYYDVQARLTAYRTQEQRLLEMMELAETVSDIIIIEDRLTELRYEIESLQSTLNNWDRQVSYSSVSVQVNEVTVYTPEATLTYGQQLGLAIQNGLREAIEFLGNLLLFLTEALPTLIILAIFVLIVVLIVKKVKKNRRAKKLRKEAQSTEQP